MKKKKLSYLISELLNSNFVFYFRYANGKRNSFFMSLFNNVIVKFENLDIEERQYMVQNGIMSKYIDVILDGQLKGPYVNIKTKNIKFHVKYLEFLWFFIYGLFYMNEGFIAQLSSGDLTGHLKLDSTILGAHQSFLWSVKEINESSTWPTHILNPIAPNSNDEKELIEKTNAIFVDAVCFLLLHEYAHLSLKHVKNSDDSINIEQEKEADKYAQDILLRNVYNEKNRVIIGVSILLAICSSFFILKNKSNITQCSHPDLDSRLIHMMEGINLMGENNKSYLYYLISLSTSLFLNEIEMPITESIVYDNTDEFYQAIQERYDELKILFE
ncbi:hypothetical protein AHYW_002735 [Providencia manganoxydans]|uniref:phage exclusion protein Lit family protein n=1 Tax=Providencia manganoxydans TaxID=2923283 RepID=UPI003B9AF87E